MSQRLSEIDPNGKLIYQSQFESFRSRWENAIVQWRQKAAPLQGLPVVVHHKDWRYLLNWLGMEEVATLEPKTGIPPNASYLSSLKKQMDEQPAKMILRTVYQDKRPSLWLSERTGVPQVELPYTVGGSDLSNDLFGLFEDTISRLINAAKNQNSK